MLEGMLPLDEVLRQSGQYGPRVEVPDDADVQTKLLAFIGRTHRASCQAGASPPMRSAERFAISSSETSSICDATYQR